WRLVQLLEAEEVNLFRGELDDEIYAVRFFRATLRLDDWRVGGPQPMSRDVECDSVLCVLLMVVLSRLSWSPFSTCLCAVEPARFQFSQCAPEGAAHYDTGSCGSVGSLRVSWSFVTPCWLCLTVAMSCWGSGCVGFSAGGWRCPATTADSAWTAESLWVALHYAFRHLVEVPEECRVELSLWPLWVLLGVVVLHCGDMLLGPVRAGCVVMVFGLSVTAAWRLFPSWCQRVVTLECVVFPDLVICVRGPEGFGFSALNLVESPLRWALCHFRALGAVAGAASASVVSNSKSFEFCADSSGVGLGAVLMRQVRGELDDEICAVRFFRCRATLHLDDWRVGGPQPVSRDVECDSILCVLLVVVFSQLPWSPFSTCLCAVEPARFQFSQCAPEEAAHYDTGSCVLTKWVRGQLACVVELRYFVLALLDYCE
ncbi:hypothetical protein Taro_015649, partial [Colocasia esculenta]|nr:hypothetical protein [Colocasia esculenta]